MKDMYGKPYRVWAIGQTLRAGDQEYVCTEFREAKRRGGATVRIAALEGKCAECGEPFEFTVGLEGAKFQPNRRCDLHKARGRKAKPGGISAEIKARDEKIRALTAENRAIAADMRAAVKDAVDACSKALRAEIKEAKAQARKEARRAERAEKRLARYELTPGEEDRFLRMSEHAQEMRDRKLREKRAKLRRVDAAMAPDASVFG